MGASAGGHMSQLLRLLEVSESWPQKPSFYVTTMNILAGKLAGKGKFYVIGECNRRHPLKAVMVLFRSLRVVITERPDVVITTGAMPLAILCLCAKIFGAKVIWVDSVANIKRFSLSGRLIRPVADLFLTQWSELAEQYDNVEYAGTIV